MLYIDEIFGPTVQGEGKYIGAVSVFVRFAKCNMSCRGFAVPYGDDKFGCDSFHAVDTIYKDSWQKFDKVEDIIAQLESLSRSCDIVITGGEPLLYWSDKQFQKLLRYFVRQDRRVTIETNGTIDIKLDKKWQKQIVFSIGLKLSNSSEPKNRRLNTKALTNIISYTKNIYIKFVIDSQNLDKTIEEILQIRDIYPGTDIYLMPLGHDSDTVAYHSHDTVKTAIKYRFLYSDRLHIRLWNNERKR